MVSPSNHEVRVRPTSDFYKTGFRDSATLRAGNFGG